MGEVKIPLFERKATGLVREIGPWGLIVINMSWAIGAGINKLSVYNGYLYPGSDVGLGFLLVAIPVVIDAACWAFLAITMPRSGGAYVFISRILSPTWAFLTTWLSWAAGWLLIGIIAYYDVYFWGLMLWSVGTAFHNPALISAGLWCQSMINSYWVSIVFLVITFAICSLRLSTMVRILQALWIIPMIGSIMMIGTYAANWGLASTSPEIFKARWDRIMGEGSYDEVMSVAISHGFDPVKWTRFSWDSTWAVAAYAGLWAGSCLGTAPTAVAGEVKTPTKTQLWGTVFGAALVCIHNVLLSTTMFHACDPFIRAYTFNFYEGYAKEYTITPNIMPLAPLFAGVLTGNMWLATFYAASTAIWLWNDIPAFFLYVTRFMFAWAFDRTFPRIFAEVHPTLRTPLYANILTFVLSIVGSTLCMGWWIYGIFTLFDQICMFGWILPTVFVDVAAAVLPILRPDIYKESPIATWTIAGIPLITILGVIGFTTMLWFTFLVMGSLMPTGKPTPDVALIVALSALGLLISLSYQAYMKKKGIPVSEVFKVIPPA